MMKSIYVFRDVLSGQYEYFGTFVNDNVAIREFKRACDEARVPAADLELYCASRLDTNTGRIYHVVDDVVLTDSPKFVCKGEDYVQDKV